MKYSGAANIIKVGVQASVIDFDGAEVSVNCLEGEDDKDFYFHIPSFSPSLPVGIYIIIFFVGYDRPQLRKPPPPPFGSFGEWLIRKIENIQDRYIPICRAKVRIVSKSPDASFREIWELQGQKKDRRFSKLIIFYRH